MGNRLWNDEGAFKLEGGSRDRRVTMKCEIMTGNIK